MKHHPTPPQLFTGSDDRLAASRRLGPLAASAVGVLVAVFCIVVVAVLGALGWWWVGVLLGIAAGTAFWIRSERTSTTNAVEALGGREMDTAEFPRLANLVDGLSATTGEPSPQVRVLDDPGVNLAVAGPSGAATLVITTGALAALDRLELEALLAAGFARIRGNDAVLAARAATILLGPLLRVDASGTGGPPWSRLGLGVRSRQLRRLLGDQREFLCDLAAVDITRYPPALESALLVMDERGTAVATATWGTAHLWVAPPMPVTADPVLSEALSVHQRNDHRVALLAEL